MLGYLYQVRMALVLLLRRLKTDPGATLTLENFDDIAFHSNGAVVEQLQTKLVTAKSLSDASVDLWKTLRVWSEQFRAGVLDPTSTSLTLLTTAEAPIGSAAYYLRLKDRDHTKALKILESTTETSKSAANAKCYEAFMRLAPTRRSQLVRATHVLDRSPDMGEALKLLRQELRLTTLPSKIEAFAARIEGWWLQTAVEQLSGEKPFIAGAALEEELSDLREQFRLDNLPIDFADAELPNDVPYDDYPFIRQLQLIRLAPRRMSVAKLDYYRATRQRGRWIDDQIVRESELRQFERKLQESWAELFESKKQECDGSDKPKTGRSIYDGAVLTQQMYLRPGCTEQFVMRGSYHLLADAVKLGWHPDFMDLMKQESVNVE